MPPRGKEFERDRQIHNAYGLIERFSELDVPLETLGGKDKRTPFRKGEDMETIAKNLEILSQLPLDGIDK